MTTQNQNQPAWLYILPAELFDMVVKLLIPLSKVCLALSSKPLFTKQYSSARIPTLENQELAILFSLLEKDSPRLVLCGEHNKLRPFDPTISQRGQGRPHYASLSCQVVVLRNSLRCVFRNLFSSSNRARRLDKCFGQSCVLDAWDLMAEPYFFRASFRHESPFVRFIDLDRRYDQSHFPLECHSEGQQVLTPEEEWIFEDENAALEYLTHPDCDFAPTAYAIYFHRPDS
ncbi:hypothetical protein MRS44_011001 [Fusarium solani]|uniref:uncharacterized protein n=1 Tax=Fusarium solani TaxID=169388 RepID=UPI0032C43D9D|nr:hypothetical protein MRS44_011001 [Fusarium solani]